MPGDYLQIYENYTFMISRQKNSVILEYLHDMKMRGTSSS